MPQKGNTSPLQIAAERDVLRQEIELNHKGVLKIALSSTDAKFNIRSGVWKKMVELVYFFLFHRKLKHH